MEGYKAQPDAVLLKFLQQRSGKMKSCRRCRGTAFVSGIYCLISVRILKFMCYIRRKRHLAQAVKYLFKYTFEFKSDQSVSVSKTVCDLTFEFTVSEHNSCTRTKLFTRSYQRLPYTLAPSSQKEDFNSGFCIFLYSEKPCGDHLCIV